MRKTGRPSPRPARPTVGKRRKKSKLSVTAVSPKSGITHHFNDLDALQALAKSYISKWNAQLEGDLIESMRLWNWLRNQKQQLNNKFISWQKPIYRIVFGGLDPLSVAGSLAAGGRFNLGGAQIVDEELFPGLQMGACLYGASSIDCAKLEAGIPLGNAELYKLTPTQPLKLWDLETTLNELSNPTLIELVRRTPMSKRWVLQKTPLFSQLLSTHLRLLGGDGLVFNSTKLESEMVLAFFVKDDRQVQSLFQAERIR
jgi:hypothetical protein